MTCSCHCPWHSLSNVLWAITKKCVHANPLMHKWPEAPSCQPNLNRWYFKTFAGHLQALVCGNKTKEPVLFYGTHSMQKPSGSREDTLDQDQLRILNIRCAMDGMGWVTANTRAKESICHRCPQVVNMLRAHWCEFHAIHGYWVDSCSDGGLWMAVAQLVFPIFEDVSWPCGWGP